MPATGLGGLKGLRESLWTEPKIILRVHAAEWTGIRCLRRPGERSYPAVKFSCSSFSIPRRSPLPLVRPAFRTACTMRPSWLLEFVVWRILPNCFLSEAGTRCRDKYILGRNERRQWIQRTRKPAFSIVDSECYTDNTGELSFRRVDLYAIAVRSCRVMVLTSTLLRRRSHTIPRPR